MATKSDGAEIVESVLIVAGAAVVIPATLALILVPTILLKAFVLTKLWAWYLAPLFGMPHLDMVHAFGVSLIANLVLPPPPRLDDKKGVKTIWSGLSYVLLAPLFALLIGWIGTFWL